MQGPGKKTSIITSSIFTHSSDVPKVINRMTCRYQAHASNQEMYTKFG